MTKLSQETFYVVLKLIKPLLILRCKKKGISLRFCTQLVLKELRLVSLLPFLLRMKVISLLSRILKTLSQHLQQRLHQLPLPPPHHLLLLLPLKLQQLLLVLQVEEESSLVLLHKTWLILKELVWLEFKALDLMEES